MSEAVSALVIATALLIVVVVDLLRRHGVILRTMHELDGGEATSGDEPSSRQVR